MGFFQVAKHETFERRGDDLHMNAKVPFGLRPRTQGILVHWEITIFLLFLDLIQMIFGYMSLVLSPHKNEEMASLSENGWFSPGDQIPQTFNHPGNTSWVYRTFFFNGISWRYQQIIDGSRELFWTSNWWKWTPLPLIFMQWHHQKLVSSLTFEAVWIYFLVTKQKRVLKAIHVVIYSLSLVILWHGIPKLQF